MALWTEEEISTLLRMWPTSSRLQIAKTLHRSPQAIGAKATYLREKGLMERPVRPITPDRKDFNAVKTDYCLKHHIDEAQLCARFKADNQLAAKLYQLAVAAKATRFYYAETEGAQPMPSTLPRNSSADMNSIGAPGHQ